MCPTGEATSSSWSCLQAGTTTRKSQTLEKRTSVYADESSEVQLAHRAHANRLGPPPAKAESQAKRTNFYALLEKQQAHLTHAYRLGPQPAKAKTQAKRTDLYADECVQLAKQQAHRAHVCRLGPQPAKAKLWKSV